MQKKVIQRLKNLHRCRYFVKEAKAIRGIPDIVGCLNGIHFELEVKRSEKEIKGKTGRHILQERNLYLVEQAGGFARFIYPENFDEVFEDLIEFCT